MKNRGLSNPSRLFLFRMSRFPYFREHLGVAFLRTMLHLAGIPSFQYLPSANPTMAQFRHFVGELDPQVIGFTVYESNPIACAVLSRAVRDVYPDVVILAGGPRILQSLRMN
jgi:hypothetical protein